MQPTGQYNNLTDRIRNHKYIEVRQGHIQIHHKYTEGRQGRICNIVQIVRLLFSQFLV